MRPAEYWPYIAPGSHIVHICYWTGPTTLCGQSANDPNAYYSASWITGPVVCETCVLWKLVEEMTQ